MNIKSIEEAVRVFEENTKKQGETFETGNYKVGNRCFTAYMKCIVYLYEHNALNALLPLLDSDSVNVRSVSAFALLPINEELSRSVLEEIAKGDYGIHGLNAEMTLQMWDQGEIVYPYQS